MKKMTKRSTVALTNDAGTTGTLDIGDFTSGEVFVPTGSTITSLTWHVAPNHGGTYLAAQDASGAVVTTVAAAKAYAIPASVMGAMSVKIVANASGNVDISLKG